MPELFDYLRSINEKQEKFDSDNNFGDYPAYVINRGVSQFLDTLFFAQEMNECHTLDAKLQYDYYYYSIPRKKRIKKWAKRSEIDERIELIQKTYGYNIKKAKEVLKLFSDDDFSVMYKYNETGGIKK